MASVLILFAGVISLRYRVYLSSGAYCIGLSSGALYYLKLPISVPGGLYISAEHSWDQRRAFNWGFSVVPGRGASVAIWIPAVAMAVCTLLLTSRRARPVISSCTECDYDLTGNISGKCPECGQLTHKISRRDPSPGLLLDTKRSTVNGDLGDEPTLRNEKSEESKPAPDTGRD